MARRRNARPLGPWESDLPVQERLLGNGLKALVLARPGAPVAVCDLYYPVGSYNEPPGRTGLAHFLEHMLFKGTTRFPKGQVDRIVFAAAGQSNAETGEDATHYWFALPADRWEVALSLEADRMTGAIFDAGEVETERRVIQEERARDQDSPLARLDESHLVASYIRHPYRNPILGWPDDLARIDRDDLDSFYRARYRPDGAVIVVVGDVDPPKTLDRIEETFGALARGPALGVDHAIAEPEQGGRREFELHESESVARGLFGWHTVPMDHRDVPALDVLSDLLTCGRRSRLWDRVVERERLATWIDASGEVARRGGQFLIQVEAAPGTSTGRVEDEILATLRKIAKEGPSAAELLRSRNRLDAAWRWEQDDVGGLASGLGDAALWGSWTRWQSRHRASIAVEPDEIRRVAATYLDERGLTVGWLLPRSGPRATVQLPGENRRTSSATPTRHVDGHPLGVSLPSTRITLPRYHPGRLVLPNGMRLLTERREGEGVVALELYVDAGQLREAKPGLAYLTGRLLEEGTTTRTADQLAEAVEDAGGSLEVGSTGASLRVRIEDLEAALEWLADLAIRPAFPDDSVSWLGRKIANEYQSDRDDPAFLADGVFRSLVYGSHPLARDARGAVRDISRLDRRDVVEHHARHFVPGNAFLSVSGDFDPSKLSRWFKGRFGPWIGVGETPQKLPALKRSSRPKSRRVSRNGEQVHILIGHLGVERTHPDYHALEILDHILGCGPGFSDRLGRIIRDEMGLAYAVGGGITDSADRLPGLFRIYVGTGPDQADLAAKAVREQIRLMHAGEFTDREVEEARRYLAGSWVFDFQTVEQRAGRLLELERWGLPLVDPLDWPDRLAAITPDEVRRAARTHLDPGALATVEYGPIRRAEAPTDADSECA